MTTEKRIRTEWGSPESPHIAGIPWPENKTKLIQWAGSLSSSAKFFIEEFEVPVSLEKIKNGTSYEKYTEISFQDLLDSLSD